MMHLCGDKLLITHFFPGFATHGLVGTAPQALCRACTVEQGILHDANFAFTVMLVATKFLILCRESSPEKCVDGMATQSQSEVIV